MDTESFCSAAISAHHFQYLALTAAMTEEIVYNLPDSPQLSQKQPTVESNAEISSYI